MRRLPRRALASLALVVLTAGCTTFSDNDAIARVGDVELSRAELDDQLAELGLEASDEALPAAFARPTISSWIQEQAIEQGLFGDEVVAAVEPELIADTYGLGLDGSGITCPELIVTDTFVLAEEAVVRLDGGEEFAAVFADLNVDPGLDATTGRFACVLRSELSADVLDTPDVAALRAVSADAPHVAAEIVDPVNGDFGVVIAFRGYDTLDDDDRAQVDAAIAPRIVVEDLDVHVDPRFGRFDPASGSVVEMD
jgi:hypothetical protein